MSLKAKLIYDQKGLDGYYLKRPLDQASGYVFRESNSDFELTYLTLPIAVQWHFGKKVDFAIGGGAYLGLLLESNESEHQFNSGFGRNFSETDFGVVGSFVAKYPLSSDFKIGFEYEFQQGFSELYNPNKTGLDHFNSRMSFNVGCYYSL